MRTFWNNLFIMLLCAAFIIPLSGCKKEGCTDRSALNYDTKAKKDDGACTYSSVLFRTYSDDFGSGLTGTTTLKLDGATIATLASGADHSHQLRDGNMHTWTAEALVTGPGFEPFTITESGTLAASPTQSTITVDVWD
jgi:hypothetical protein